MIHRIGAALLGTLGGTLAMLTVSSLAMGKVMNLEHAHVPDQLIVTFKPGLAEANVHAALAPLGGKVLHTFRSSGAVLVQLAPSELSLERRGEILANSPSVAGIEANTIITIDATMPNDADFSRLYGLHNEGATGGTVNADIDAPEAWDITTGSRNVLVGIIDTGVDYTHPDIAPNYWTNPGESGLDENGNDKRFNGIDDDGNGFVDDWRGWDFVNNDNDPLDDNDHGTHCAGTIGASGNDGVGVVGVNWEVSMVGIKFLSGAGSGTLADAVKAIEYATSLGVTLTSNSWGGGGFSSVMEAAIREAEEKGILFVAAAGNSRADNDRMPHYPSSYENDNVISVAATDHNDNLASFSCYGLNSVDVGAPGVNIFSTTKGGRYAEFSGTSMATPHVAGVAALVKAAYPEATAAQIKDRILNTADPVSSLAGKTLTGARLNAFNALENDTVAPNAVGSVVVEDATSSSVSLKWAPAGDDGAEGRANRYEVRFADAPIDSEEAWQAAARPGSMTIQLGADEVKATVAGLPFNSEGYLAVKAIDNVGNVGPMSASFPYAVRKVLMVAGHDAESMDGVTADAPWGLQASPTRSGTVFSDSPEGDYGPNLNASLTLDPIQLTSEDVLLTFDTSYDLERNYDLGHVEISIDGGASWITLERLTGGSDWTRKVYPLADKLAGASTLTVRFRMTTDYSVSGDGWLIDNVALFAPLD